MRQEEDDTVRISVALGKKFLPKLDCIAKKTHRTRSGMACHILEEEIQRLDKEVKGDGRK